MATLTDMEHLRRVLARLSAERPAGLGEHDGETKHQEREGDLLRRLGLEIQSREGKARVLVTGQIGVGKSSELRHFFRQRVTEKRAAGFWVYCDLEKEEHPERCGATGVFLTVFRDCWAATRFLRENLAKQPETIRNKFLRLEDEILERLIDWLKGERSADGEAVTFRFGGMDFPVFLRDKGSALYLILGKASQHEAVSERSERFGLVPDSLVNLLNKLLRWVTEVHRGRPPVLIVDHVDKIRDPSSAREVLVEVVPQWQRIEASIIMTAPYEYTLGEMRHSVESSWGKPLMVYPLEIPQLDSRTLPPIYMMIVESCGLVTLISVEGLQHLAYYSGGIPRSFVQFLIQACKEAHLAGHKRIEPADAEAVIHNAEKAYQDYGMKEMEILDQIDEKKMGLAHAVTLLRSPIGLLVMPAEAGEQPLRVHPLVERLLDRYRIQKERAAI